MPFVRQVFEIKEPIVAFVFIQKILKCNNKEAQRIIDKGRVRHLSGLIVVKNEKISGSISVDFFKPDGKIPPFFIHSDFALFDKPPHLLTHPKGRFNHPSLCDSIKAFLGADANPVHRLDYETSGIILASRNKKNEATLKRFFEKSEVKKCYLALVDGRVPTSRVIDLPILVPKDFSKHQDLGIRSQISEKGKKAITFIEVLGYFKNQTFLKVFPLTGRTHQIRLHLSAIGHQIVNEPLYSDDESARIYIKNKLSCQREPLRLHARSLRFCYQGKYFDFKTPELPKWVKDLKLPESTLEQV